jgi:protein TonB
VQPRPKNIVQPEYPEAAKLIGAEGQIFVQVTIGADGNVKAAKIVKSFNNDACNKVSIKAALRSKWYPGTRDGKPAEMKQTYPYIFTSD